MVLIYDESGGVGAHDALVAQLRAEGQRPFIRTVRHYSGPEAGAEVVYTDDPFIAADYDARGAAVHPLAGAPDEEASDEEASDEEPEEGAEPPDEGIHPKGGGYYAVRVGGDEVDSVQGAAQAQARYEELQGADLQRDDSTGDDSNNDHSG